MDSSQAELKLFDAIRKVNPKNFSEFNTAAHDAVAVIADVFGIAKAEYFLSVSEEFGFETDFPENVVFFDKNVETKPEPIRLEYPFSNGGKIEFLIYINLHSELFSGELRLLEINCRQLYYVVNDIILENTCRELIFTDYQSGIPSPQALIRFIIDITNRKVLDKYTALFFNIHNFKSVHRSLSYIEGNEIMKKYCQTVAGAITKNEIVARLGSDNFMAIILDDNLDYFLDLLQNMIISHEKDGKKFSFMFSATVGLAKLTNDYDLGSIMLNANAAYQSARESRSLMKIYDKQVSVSLIERKTILSSFHKALSDKEFFAVYQPKVSVKDRKLHGAEALVRWNRDGQNIMPGSFIPILEYDGCICTLDFYILNEVCKLQKKLIDMKLEPVRISVNFSKRHLSNNRLVEEISEVIGKYGIPNDLIEIELTESEDSYNQGVLNDVVNELCALGIRTSIDDFGTGYSSLGMLKSLKLHDLKIDKSFIPFDPINHNDKSVLMLNGIIELAKSLGLTIVAEGVETDSQLELIEKMGCDIVQGYIFDKPLVESDFIERVKCKDYTFK